MSVCLILSIQAMAQIPDKKPNCQTLFHYNSGHKGPVFMPKLIYRFKSTQTTLKLDLCPVFKTKLSRFWAPSYRIPTVIKKRPLRVYLNNFKTYLKVFQVHRLSSPPARKCSSVSFRLVEMSLGQVVLGQPTFLNKKSS